MQIVIEADKGIVSIWNAGKIKAGTYRLFTYTVFSDVKNGFILHNSCSGEMLLLSDDEKRHLLSLPCEYSPWMDELIRRHFIVPINNDDAKTVDSLRSMLKILQKRDGITNYYILPTMDCNARCFYCFEKRMGHENMSDETADKVVTFIDSHRKGKPVQITWFGGEPLVGIKQIDRICHALNEKGIEFVSDIETNGSLFTEEIVQRAKEDWHLWKAQITLDGTESIHNQTKAYVNLCDNPFERTIENIRLLMDNQIYVWVRLNVGMHNVDDLEKLIIYLSEEFPDKEYLWVYTKALFNHTGTVPYSDNEFSLINEAQIKLENLRIRAGFAEQSNVEIPKLRSSNCMADRDERLLITPSGRLGKCTISMNDCIVGDLDIGILDKEKMVYFKEKKSESYCRDCCIYPYCIRLKTCKAEVCSQDEFVETQSMIKARLKNYYDCYLSKGELQNERNN